MHLVVHTYDYIHIVHLLMSKTLLTILWIFRHLTKGIKLFISGLTFTRGNDQPFRSNVIAFLFSLRADIQTFGFLKIQ